jgi:release factor glutamine methyltransferase
VTGRTPERETWGILLRAARDRMRAAGIESPEIEAEVLMRQALRRPGDSLPTKAWLLPRLGQDTTETLRGTFEGLVSRRLGHEPTAYITGVREFHSLEFEVTPDVLIPRPETELLVGKAVEWAYGSSPRWSPYPGLDAATLRMMQRSKRTKDDPLRIVDVGTGSGAIAIALARSLPAATIIATDVSWQALAIARRNAARHGVGARVSFRHGDLLSPVDCYVDLIVANLPYIPDGVLPRLAPEVRDHEPSLAFVGGSDGLDLIRALLYQAPRYLRPDGALCLEFGMGQSASLREAVVGHFPTANIQLHDDFAGIPRVLVATLDEN